jgi:hypothetical protein
MHVPGTIERSITMKRVLEWGGLAAGAIMIIFGAVTIFMSFDGQQTVKDSLKAEYIVGSPDMTPTAIKEEAKAAGLDVSKLDLPTESIAGKTIDNGSKARVFAQYMRIHTLESTGGETYAQMGRYVTPSGKDTNDAAAAAKDPKTGQPVANGKRDIWVTETALTTALNMSYMAQQLALFSLVIGIALVLSGFGFIILALVAIGGVKVPERKRATKPAIA